MVNMANIITNGKYDNDKYKILVLKCTLFWKLYYKNFIIGWNNLE